MAALSITAAQVTAPSNSPTATGIAHTAITAGEVVFLDAANNNKVNLATNANAAGSKAVGIALNNAAAGQPVTYVRAGGRINVTGATFTVGTPYFLDAGGDIIPLADLANPDYVTFIGIGITTTSMLFDPVVSGVQVPA